MTFKGSTKNQKDKKRRFCCITSLINIVKQQNYGNTKAKCRYKIKI